MAKKKHILKFEEKTDMGSSAARRIRRGGRVPGIIYGHGKESRALTVDQNEWQVLAGQEIQIIYLKPSKGKDIPVLIKDVQYDFLNGITLHIDFLEVRMDEEITAEVPIHTHGQAPGVTHGGVVDQMLHEVEIRCLPTDLPEHIEVDISGLELDGAIHVKDLPVPENTTVETDPEQVVVHLVLPTIEKEPEDEELEGLEGEEGAETEAGDESPQEPEVIGEKKDSDEDSQ